MQQTS